MHVREQKQLNPVQDEVLALTAVVRPILAGTLYALKADIVQEAGGYENLKLKMLPRLYRAGDGDCGICFEYAVHEAISRGDGSVLERMTDAAKLCRLEGDRPKSILFGLEKSGTQQLIDTAANTLTDESRLLMALGVALPTCDAIYKQSLVPFETETPDRPFHTRLGDCGRLICFLDIPTQIRTIGLEQQ